MRALYVIVCIIVTGCNSTEKKEFTEVDIEILFEDTVSIRAIEIMGEDLAFAGNNGMYGLYDSQAQTMRSNVQQYDSITPEFRAVASTSSNFFMLSVGNPALLYKTGDTGQMELVYKEEHENIFYDAMTFWNDQEGIAMGDPTEGCLSVIITRDGGNSWEKLSCELLPEVEEGEAAFAASNSNIAIKEDHTWILSGGMRSRIFYSPDRGRNWEVFETPLVQGRSTTGGYSMDFFDEKRGVVIGGDYTDPENNVANKAITRDGGKTWKLIADGNDPGYMSSIRFVPGSDAQGIVAVGSTGISYSSNAGNTWSTISKEGFHTIRFLNDSTAYAAGESRVGRLKFR